MIEVRTILFRHYFRASKIRLKGVSAARRNVLKTRSGNDFAQCVFGSDRAERGSAQSERICRAAERRSCRKRAISDSKGFYYLAHDYSGIRKQPLDGGSELFPEFAGERINNFAFSPDGKNLVVARSNPMQNIAALVEGG
jgi:hypothetical protein